MTRFRLAQRLAILRHNWPVVLFWTASITPPASSAPPPIDGILILAIDTLRSDHLGCYGYPKNTTPELDALAQDAVLFERHYTHASWSLPSYSSLFTGAFPTRHGVLDQQQRLSDSFYTIAEIAKLYGFRTAGFVGGSHLTSIFNLNQGFDVWQDRPHFGSLFFNVPRAIDYLERLNDDDPFLLFVQGYDCHSPYYTPLGIGERFDPDYEGIVHEMGLLVHEKLHRMKNGSYYPEVHSSLARFPRFLPVTGQKEIPLSEDDIRHIRAHYAAAVSYADTWAGVLLESLKRSGRYDRTLIIVLGDHGEDLMEHGFFYHRNQLYRQVIQTPLLIKFPNNRHGGKRIASPVGTIDIPATLIDLLGATPPENQLDGRSLLGTIEGTADAPPPVGAVLTDQESIIDGKWHLLVRTGKTRRYDPPVELFDLENDPDELKNVASEHPNVVKELSSAFDRWRQLDGPEATPLDLDGELKRALIRGGYWEPEE